VTARKHRLLPSTKPERPNRWLGAATCQCVCGCTFIAVVKPPDWKPSLCIYCAKGKPVGQL
jgi:hypothetical protein